MAAFAYYQVNTTELELDGKAHSNELSSGLAEVAQHAGCHVLGDERVPAV